MNQVSIQLPDGSRREVPAGTSVLDIAAGISPRLAKAAVAGVVVLVLSLRTLAPFDNPLAYFLGLTSFFYSGLAPSALAFAMLGAAGAIGAFSSAIAVLMEARIHRPAAALTR